MKIKNLSLKIVALFTLLCFTFSTFDKAWAQLPSVVSAPASSEYRIPSLAEKIEIPENLGTIAKRYRSPQPSSSTVIHIQDAHDNVQAQQHLYQILQYLQRQYKAELIFLEGGMDKLRPELLDFLGTRKENRRVMAELEKKGLAGGTEKFLLESYHSKKPVLAYGVENPALYGKNLRDYRSVLNHRELSREFLEKFEGLLLAESSRKFNKDLKNFFKSYSFYQAHPESFAHYLPALEKAGREHKNLDLRRPESQLDWPQLVRLARLQDLGERLDFPQAKKEAEQLREWMKTHGTDAHFTQLLHAAVEGKTAFDNARLVAEKFYDLAAPKGFSFENYPALNLALGRRVLQSELQASELFDEIERLSMQILESLAQSPEEKTLLENYRCFLKLRKLFPLELVRSDYQDILKHRETLRPSEIFKTVVPQMNSKSLSRLDALYKKALDFYEGAVRREQIMQEQVIAKTRQHKKPVAVLISGGFHKDGIENFLEKEKISYVQIMPRISDIKDTNGYQSVMTLQNQNTVTKATVNHPTPVNTFSEIAVADPDIADTYRNGITGVLDALEITPASLSQRADLVTALNQSPAARGHQMVFELKTGQLTPSPLTLGHSPLPLSGGEGQGEGAISKRSELRTDEISAIPEDPETQVKILMQALVDKEALDHETPVLIDQFVEIYFAKPDWRSFFNNFINGLLLNEEAVTAVFSNLAPSWKFKVRELRDKFAVGFLKAFLFAPAAEDMHAWNDEIQSLYRQYPSFHGVLASSMRKIYQHDEAFIRSIADAQNPETIFKIHQTIRRLMGLAQKLSISLDPEQSRGTERPLSRGEARTDKRERKLSGGNVSVGQTRKESEWSEITQSRTLKSSQPSSFVDFSSGVNHHPDNSTTTKPAQRPIFQGGLIWRILSEVTEAGTRIVNIFRNAWPTAFRLLGPKSVVMGNIVADNIYTLFIISNTYFQPSLVPSAARSEVRRRGERFKLGEAEQLPLISIFTAAAFLSVLGIFIIPQLLANPVFLLIYAIAPLAVLIIGIVLLASLLKSKLSAIGGFRRTGDTLGVGEAGKVLIRPADREVQGFGVWKIGEYEITEFGAAVIKGPGIWQKANGERVREDNGFATPGGIPVMTFANGRTVDGDVLAQDKRLLNVLGSPLARTADGPNGKHLLHGFSDKVQWRVEEAATDSITFSLKSSDVILGLKEAKTLVAIIGNVEWRQTYAIENGALKSTLETINHNTRQQAVLGGGYHPFYQVENIEEWTIQIPAGKYWTTDSTPFEFGYDAQPKDVTEAEDFREPKPLRYGLELTLSGLKQDADGNINILLHNTVTQEDRRISFPAKDFPYLLLWVPPKDKAPAPGVFSVEPLFGIPNARNMYLSGNPDVKPLVLEPGVSHIATWIYHPNFVAAARSEARLPAGKTGSAEAAGELVLTPEQVSSFARITQEMFDAFETIGRESNFHATNFKKEVRGGIRNRQGLFITYGEMFEEGHVQSPFSQGYLDSAVNLRFDATVIEKLLEGPEALRDAGLDEAVQKEIDANPSSTVTAVKEKVSEADWVELRNQYAAEVKETITLFRKTADEYEAVLQPRSEVRAAASEVARDKADHRRTSLIVYAVPEQKPPAGKTEDFKRARAAPGPTGRQARGEVRTVQPLAAGILRDEQSIVQGIAWKKKPDEKGQSNEYVFGGGDGYDIRINNSLKDWTEATKFYYVMGRTLGGSNYLNHTGKALITGDQRFTSDAFRLALMQGLADEGIEVFTPPKGGVIPSGLASRKALADEDYQLVVQVTGSHNPPEGNGAKITYQGNLFFGPQLMGLSQAIENKEGWSKRPVAYVRGRIKVLRSLIPEHIEALHQVLPDLEKSPSLIADFKQGAGGSVFIGLAEKKGYQIVRLDSPEEELPNEVFDPAGKPVLIVLNEKPSAGMGTGIWDPSKPEAFDGIRKVQQRIEGDPRVAQLKGRRYGGVVLDGDGDRAGFVTEKGGLLLPERVMMAFYQRMVLDNLEGIRILNHLKHSVKISLIVLASKVSAQVLQGLAQENRLNIQTEFISAGAANQRKFVLEELTKIEQVLKNHPELTAAERAAVEKLMLGYVAAETSGHFYFNILDRKKFLEKKIVVDDGVVSSFLFLDLLSSRQKTMEEADALFPRLPITHEIRLKGAPQDVKKKQEFAEKAILGFAERNPDLIPMTAAELGNQIEAARQPPQRQPTDEELILVDGIRLVLENGVWILLRKSNTSAVIVFKAEAESPEKLPDLVKTAELLGEAMVAVKGQDPAFAALDLKEFEAEVNRLRSLQLRTKVTAPDEFAKATAQEVAEEIRSLQKDSARSVNIVFATGNTMKGFFDELSREADIDWTRIQAFHLDEYLGLATDHPASFAYFLKTHLFDKVPSLPKGNIHYVNGAQYDKDAPDANRALMEEYMEKLHNLGGADIVILGVGMDGHLAFNEPPKYSKFDSRMQVVELDESTLKANEPDYREIRNNPFAITMGMADIMEGRHLFFFANGKKKSDIVKQSLEGPVTEKVPASVLQTHYNVTVVLDTDAASLLKRQPPRAAPGPTGRQARGEVRENLDQLAKELRGDELKAALYSFLDRDAGYDPVEYQKRIDLLTDDSLLREIARVIQYLRQMLPDGDKRKLADLVLVGALRSSNLFHPYRIEKKLPPTFILDGRTVLSHRGEEQSYPQLLALTSDPDFVGVTVIYATTEDQANAEQELLLARANLSWYREGSVAYPIVPEVSRVSFEEKLSGVPKLGVPSVLDEALRTAHAARDVNPFWDVSFDGGSVVLVAREKEGAEEGAYRKESLEKWAASAITANLLLDKLLVSRGVNVYPSDMKVIEDAALRVQKELALEQRTFAATGEDTFLKGTTGAVDLAWHAKAVGIVENLRTFTQDEELMSRLGLHGRSKLRVAIQGFGYLTAEIIEYLKELQESGEALNFEIVGVSDVYGGVYEPNGIPMEQLVTLKNRYRETTARHQKSNVRQEYHKLTRSLALPLGPLNDFFHENFEADVVIATSPVAPIILGENLGNMKKNGVKILLQGGPAPQTGEADQVQTIENTSSPFLYLPYALVGGGDVYTASEEYFHFPTQRELTARESAGLYIHIIDGVRELALTNAQWMLQQLRDGNFERSPSAILNKAIPQIRGEKAKLLNDPPVLVEQRAELDFHRGVRRTFALKTAATESAREKVIYEDDNVFALRMDLNQDVRGKRGRERRRLIDRQRRAAYIMGKLRKRDAVSDLVEVLRDREQDPQVRANAAEALGNIGDGVASREVLEQRANDRREHPKVQAWANWALRKLAAIERVGIVTEKTPGVDVSDDQLDSETGEVMVRGYEVMSRKVAQRILEVVKEKKKTGKPALIMLPTGSTPEGLYKVLREIAEEGGDNGFDFSDVILFHLDEYIFDQDRFYDDAGKLKPVFQEQTYKHFMETHVVNPLKEFAKLSRFNTPIEHPEVLRRKAGESEAAYIERAEQVAQDYEKKLTEAIEEAGGIDLVVLGIGGGYMEGGAIQGGHIAFNESGEQSQYDSKTRAAKLSEKTRMDAQGRFGGLHATPHYAITMGMKRILEAKEILMLGSGEDKAAVVEEALNGEISSNFPASFLRLHEKATYYLDRDAAVALPEMTKPWLFPDKNPKNRDWTDPRLVSKAVYYLLQVRRKTLGQLQRSDFIQNGFNDLLEHYKGRGGLQEIKKIAKKQVIWHLHNPKKGQDLLPSNATVVFFSPHPDDDVLTSGVTLQHLVNLDRGNNVHIGYLVPGHGSVWSPVLSPKGGLEDLKERYKDEWKKFHKSGELPAAAAFQNEFENLTAVPLMKDLLTSTNLPDELAEELKKRDLEAALGRFKARNFSADEVTSWYYEDLEQHVSKEDERDALVRLWIYARTLKREEEAREAVKVLGVKQENLKFFRLGYYSYRAKVHTREKYQAPDYAKVLDWLRGLYQQAPGKEIHIFLSHEIDPHGAHGIGAKIIERAMKDLAKDLAKEGVQVTPWWYRGAYEEFPLEEDGSNVVVPASPQSFENKKKSIWAHASQRVAMFPGLDRRQREFWERVFDRNERTGRLLDALEILDWAPVAAEVFSRQQPISTRRSGSGGRSEVRLPAGKAGTTDDGITITPVVVKRERVSGAAKAADDFFASAGVADIWDNAPVIASPPQFIGGRSNLGFEKQIASLSAKIRGGLLAMTTPNKRRRNSGLSAYVEPLERRLALSALNAGNQLLDMDSLAPRVAAATASGTGNLSNDTWRLDELIQVPLGNGRFFAERAILRPRDPLETVMPGRPAVQFFNGGGAPIMPQWADQPQSHDLIRMDLDVRAAHSFQGSAINLGDAGADLSRPNGGTTFSFHIRTDIPNAVLKIEFKDTHSEKAIVLVSGQLTDQFKRVRIPIVLLKQSNPEIDMTKIKEITFTAENDRLAQRTGFFEIKPAGVLAFPQVNASATGTLTDLTPFKATPGPLSADHGVVSNVITDYSKIDFDWDLAAQSDPNKKFGGEILVFNGPMRPTLAGPNDTLTFRVQSSTGALNVSVSDTVQMGTNPDGTPQYRSATLRFRNINPQNPFVTITRADLLRAIRDFGTEITSVSFVVDSKTGNSGSVAIRTLGLVYVPVIRAVSAGELTDLASYDVQPGILNEDGNVVSDFQSDRGHFEFNFDLNRQPDPNKRFGGSILVFNEKLLDLSGGKTLVLGAAGTTTGKLVISVSDDVIEGQNADGSPRYRSVSLLVEGIDDVFKFLKISGDALLIANPNFHTDKLTSVSVVADRLLGTPAGRVVIQSKNLVHTPIVQASSNAVTDLEGYEVEPGPLNPGPVLVSFKQTSREQLEFNFDLSKEADKAKRFVGAILTFGEAKRFNLNTGDFRIGVEGQGKIKLAVSDDVPALNADGSPRLNADGTPQFRSVTILVENLGGANLTAEAVKAKVLEANPNFHVDKITSISVVVDEKTAGVGGSGTVVLHFKNAVFAPTIEGTVYNASILTQIVESPQVNATVGRIGTAKPEGYAAAFKTSENIFETDYHLVHSDEFFLATVSAGFFVDSDNDGIPDKPLVFKGDTMNLGSSITFAAKGPVDALLEVQAVDVTGNVVKFRIRLGADQQNYTLSLIGNNAPQNFTPDKIAGIFFAGSPKAFGTDGQIEIEMPGVIGPAVIEGRSELRVAELWPTIGLAGAAAVGLGMILIAYQFHRQAQKRRQQVIDLLAVKIRNSEEVTRLGKIRKREGRISFSRIDSRRLSWDLVHQVENYLAAGRDFDVWLKWDSEGPVELVDDEAAEHASITLRSETRMLVLSRKVDETIVIGDDIRVTVVGRIENRVKLSIQAPPGISVDPMELHDQYNRKRAKVRTGLTQYLDPKYKSNWGILLGYLLNDPSEALKLLNRELADPSISRPDQKSTLEDLIKMVSRKLSQPDPNGLLTIKGARLIERRRSESVAIGDNIVVKFISVDRGLFRIGIEALTEIPVHRLEVYEAIQREAAGGDPSLRSESREKWSPIRGTVNAFRNAYEVSTALQDSLRDAMGKVMKRELPGNAIMLRNFQAPPKAEETAGRIFVDLDAGGTNVRVVRRQQNADGTFKVLKSAEPHPFTKKEKTNALALTDRIAASIAEVLPKNKNTEIELTWSFPVKLTRINEGRIVGWSKGWNIPEMVGKDPVALIRAALKRRGIGTDKVQMTVLQNDTTRGLKQGRLRDSNTTVGLVASTGFNIAYYENLEAINMEMGAHGDKVYQEPYAILSELFTEIDWRVDAESGNAGEHLLEKVISSKYLAAQVRLQIRKMMQKNQLFTQPAPHATLLEQVFHTKQNIPYAFSSRPDALDPKYLSDILSDKTPDLRIVRKILKELGIAKSTYEERKAVRDIVNIVMSRSAIFLAVAIAATLKKVDPKLQRKQSVALDSSLWDAMPGYARKLKRALGEILGPNKVGDKKQFRLFSIRSPRRRSSGGRSEVREKLQLLKQGDELFNAQTGVSNQGTESAAIQNAVVGDRQMYFAARLSQNNVGPQTSKIPAGFLKGFDRLRAGNDGEFRHLYGNMKNAGRGITFFAHRIFGHDFQTPFDRIADIAPDGRKSAALADTAGNRGAFGDISKIFPFSYQNSESHRMNPPFMKKFSIPTSARQYLKRSHALRSEVRAETLALNKGEHKSLDGWWFDLQEAASGKVVLKYMKESQDDDESLRNYPGTVTFNQEGEAHTLSSEIASSDIQVELIRINPGKSAVFEVRSEVRPLPKPQRAAVNELMAGKTLDSRFRGNDNKRKVARNDGSLEDYFQKAFGISLAAVETVYENVAQQTVAVLPREIVEKVLAAIRGKHQISQAKGAEKMAAVTDAVRQALGPKYANLLSNVGAAPRGRPESGQAQGPAPTGQKPIHLVLPIDLSAKPEELAALVTLLISPKDAIHLVLQDKTVTASTVRDYQSQINKVLADKNVRPELIQQIHIYGVSSPREFAVQAQRLIGNRNDAEVQRGVASYRVQDLNGVPNISGLYKMLGAETLKHPYAMGLIASAFLRDAREAAQLGMILKLDTWMQARGMDASFASHIQIALDAFNRSSAAA